MMKRFIKKTDARLLVAGFVLLELLAVAVFYFSVITVVGVLG